MKRFILNGYVIELDDRCQHYNEILISYKHMAEQSKYKFLQKCSQCKDMDILVKDVYTYGWEEIDLCLDNLMTVLVGFGIYHLSKDDIFAAYMDDYFNYAEMYTECYLQPYLDIIMTKQQLEELREQQKIGSSRWGGGGFGISGALKGAATAGVMNLAASGVRSIFAGIGTGMDNAKIRKLKNKMFEDKELLEEMAVSVKKCCGNVSVVLIEILRTTGYLDGNTGWDLERSNTIYKNSFYANTQKVEMLVEALRLYPYNWNIYLELFHSTSRFDRQVASVAAYFGFEMELRLYFIEYVPIHEIVYSDALIEEEVSIQTVWKNYRELSKNLQKMGLMDSGGTLKTSLLEDFQFYSEIEMLESELAKKKRRLRKVEGVTCHSMNDVKKIIHDYAESYKASAEKAMYEYAIKNGESNPANDYASIAEEPIWDECAELIRMDEENLIQNTLLYFEKVIGESENQIAFVFTDRCLYMKTDQAKTVRIEIKNVRKAEIERIEDKDYLFITVEGGQDKLKLLLPEYNESYKLDVFINQLIQCGERYKADREAECTITLSWNQIDKNAFNDFDTVLTMFNRANEIQGFGISTRIAMQEYLTKIKVAEIRKQLVDLLDENKVTSNTLEDVEKELQTYGFLSDWTNKEILEEIEDAKYTLGQRTLDKMWDDVANRNPKSMDEFFNFQKRLKELRECGYLEEEEGKRFLRQMDIFMEELNSESQPKIIQAIETFDFENFSEDNYNQAKLFLEWSETTAVMQESKAVSNIKEYVKEYEKKNEPSKLDITTLIIGISAVLTICLCIGSPLGIVGLVCGTLALKRKDNSHYMAIAGIIMSGIAVLLSVIVVIIAVFLSEPEEKKNGLLDGSSSLEVEETSGVVQEPSSISEEVLLENETVDVVEESIDDGYVFADSDLSYLTEAEINVLSMEEKVEAYYEILARKGIIFNDGEVQAFFDQKKWYKPLVEESEFDISVLNEYENVNMQLIQSIVQREPKQDMNSEETSTAEDMNAPESEISADYILPESNSRYYDSYELSELSKGELRLARNEIYARHGRMFETEDLNQYFSSQPWYTGYLSADEFDESVFNGYEKANLELIKSVEDEKASTGIATLAGSDVDWYLKYEEIETEVSSFYNNVSSQEEYTKKLMDEYQQWDKFLNEIYQYLKALYPDHRFEKIREDQRNWLKERDQAANQAIVDADGEYEDDAYYYVMISKTKERSQYLMDECLPVG